MTTPCANTGQHHNCRLPQRIFNTWSILEEYFPQEYINMVLIDKKLER
jgi:hypothetical protein